MTLVTISTKKYVEKLLDLFGNNIPNYSKIGEEFFFSLPYCSFKDIISYEQLENALEDIVLQNNDAIGGCKNAESALQFMKKALFMPHRKSIIYDIASIIECKGELNIDGYIDFKMQEYALEIDRILYFAVKKAFKNQGGEQ